MRGIFDGCESLKSLVRLAYGVLSWRRFVRVASRRNLGTSFDGMVSFIVPCYNYAHFLGECVSSILRQSYTRFEVLIMDDQSPDNTPEVAGAFGDARVVHIRNERNLGLIANINKGLELA